MYPFVVALHVVLCTFLILVIMLQPGKGGDVGAAFGSGLTSSVFGPRGPAGLLQRVTTGVAVLFMCTSLALALYSKQSVQADADVEDALERILSEEEAAPAAPAPAEPAAPGVEPVDAPGASQ
jgi:preprotein translocase subunit SecG